MSYQNEIESLSDLATAMFATPGNAPFNLTVGGLQAGAYAGVAIILIMTLGATAPAGIRALIMGSAFGLALILVVIGGAALFTGHNLYSSVAVAGKKLSLLNAIKLNTWVFVSNLVGALLLVVIYWMGQGPLTHGHCSCRTWSSVQLAGMPCLMDSETSRKQLSQMHCYRLVCAGIHSCRL